MIKHISQLHISDKEEYSKNDSEDSEEDCQTTSYSNDFTAKNFKQNFNQLSNVKRITISEQFKHSLKMDENTLFSKIYNKHLNTGSFSSCRSLVIWKPPHISLDNILSVYASKTSDDELTNISQLENEGKAIKSSSAMEID